MLIADLIIGLILGVVALAVLGFLVLQLLRGLSVLLKRPPLKFPIFSWSGLKATCLSYRQKQSLKAIQDSLSKEAFATAQKQIAKFLGLPQGASKRSWSQCVENPLAVLRLLISSAEQRQVRLSTLPRVEELLIFRQSLMKRYLEATQAIERLKEASKKGSTAWATTEFKEKLAEAEKQLLLNDQKLAQELLRILEDLQRRLDSQEIVYH